MIWTATLVRCDRAQPVKYECGARGKKTAYIHCNEHLPVMDTRLNKNATNQYRVVDEYTTYKITEMLYKERRYSLGYQRARNWHGHWQLHDVISRSQKFVWRARRGGSDSRYP